MFNKLFDETNPSSIEHYAQNLIGKTFADIVKEDSENPLVREDENNYGDAYENKKRKGGLGNLIEECYFHYKCNNISAPDFEEAGVELKVTPYKINTKGTLTAKERLILTMIDYNKVVTENFYDSHMWYKCELMLLVYYLHKNEIANRLDYKIDYAKLFTPPKEDLEIIKNDFNIIVNKIKAGKAHELSESDTLYLGAATKSASSSNRTEQPFSDIPAKPRAFSYKNSYMTYVLNNYIIPNKSTYEPIIKKQTDLVNMTFEEYVISQINKHIGKSDKELCTEFERDYNNNNAQWIDLAYRMLGIKSNQAEEFIKANIVVKAIRLEENNKMRESMSFPTFKFKELAKEEWETSTLYTYFNETRFLFVVYKKEGDSYVLKGSQLWNMPYNDLNTIVCEGWQKTKDIINEGVTFNLKETKAGIVVANNLIKKKDNPIIHVRPHANKGAYKLSNGYTVGNIEKDANELPDGQWMTTQCFWINNSYIIKQFNESIQRLL